MRINGFGTPWWADDLEALSTTPVGGVMLAMVDSVDHVTETAKRLPDVPIVALVETARGLERISEIAAAKGTFRLAFGIARQYGNSRRSHVLLSHAYISNFRWRQKLHCHPGFR